MMFQIWMSKTVRSIHYTDSNAMSRAIEIVEDRPILRLKLNE